MAAVFYSPLNGRSIAALFVTATIDL